MSVTIGLSAAERDLAERYARLHSLTLGEAFKQALFEKIEDEYDIAIAREAREEYVRSDGASRPVEALWSELDL